MADRAPPALLDAILVEVVRRLVDRHGARVPLSAVRTELGALSDDAVTVALLDAEQHGAIELVSSGERPDPSATWWLQGDRRGLRGCLCWVRLTHTNNHVPQDC